MVVELNGNDEHSLTWSNRNGRLSVKMNYPNKGEMAAMTLYCDSISTIIADGADLTAKSSLQNKTLDILVKGGSKVNAEISCTDLKISVTESSVAIINGQSTYVSSQVRSKSVLDTRRLTAESMEATVKTKSEVYLYSTRRMVVDAAQDSKVFYKGEPYVLRSRTASGSAINSIGK